MLKGNSGVCMRRGPGEVVDISERSGPPLNKMELLVVKSHRRPYTVIIRIENTVLLDKNFTSYNRD